MLQKTFFGSLRNWFYWGEREEKETINKDNYNKEYIKVKENYGSRSVLDDGKTVTTSSKSQNIHNNNNYNNTVIILKFITTLKLLTIVIIAFNEYLFYLQSVYCS